MKHSEKELKKAIIQSTQSIKKKYRDLHKERFFSEENFREHFKPIIDPLNKFIGTKEQLLNIESNINNDHPKEIQEIQTEEHRIFNENNTSNLDDSSDSGINSKFVNTSSRSTNESLISLKSCDDISKILDTKHHDKRFGIRKLSNGFMLARTVVKLNDDKVYVNKKNFKLTDGLRNLLFLTQPKVYTDKDLKAYKEILLLTGANAINLDSASDVKRVKYKEIIQPLFKTGNGIQTEYMQLNKESKSSEYTYWDDPNELIERLHLLISSNSAGHNAHNNEIVSIIEELKEAYIIF